MNDILAKKCEDPIQFDKIKYMIHSLDKEKMNQIILEICEINPYLAVICHNTAEEDYSLKHAIVEKLKVLKIDTLHKAIVLCLACDATYVPPQCRGERSNKLQKDYDFTRRTCKDLIKIILKGKGRRKLAEQYGIDIDILDMGNRGFQNESSFWLDAFFRCIIRRYPSKLSKCLQKININKESYMAELIVACSFSRYAKRGAIKRWLNLVDRLWLYGKLDELGFDFKRDFNFLVKSISKLEKRYEAMRFPMITLIELGVLQGEITLEYAEQCAGKSWLGTDVKKLKKYLNNCTDKEKEKEKLLGGSCTYVIKEQEKILAYCCTKIKKNEIVLADWWNEEKNAISIKEFSEGHADIRIWWKCSCGFSWREIVFGKKIKCRKCGKSVVLK